MKDRQQMSEKELIEIQEKLSEVQDKAYKIRRQYDWNPPDELKQELLMALQNIIE